METPKTFKELFANTGIEPTTDESGNTHYNFKATLKEEPKQETLGKEFYESADKIITIKRQETAVEWLYEELTNNFFDIKKSKEAFEQAKEMEKEQKGYSDEDMINFVEFVSKYYSDDLMENSTIYELLEQFKNK